MGADLRFLLRVTVHLLVLRPLLHLIFGLSVRGRENLPRHGSFILAANHNSHLDILLLFASLPLCTLARTHAVAAKDYFAPHKKLFAAVSFLFQPVWVDRQQRDSDPVATMSRWLAAGENIVIFPEGTRGEAGTIAEFFCGVGKLVARHPEVPVLPVFLLGTERALPRKASLPVPLWNHVNIGPPLAVGGGADEITDALRESILTLARSETARRHRRRSGRRDVKVVAVLGIDGSGKSTLSRRLAENASELASPGGGPALATTCLIGDRLELFAGGGSRSAQPLLKEKLRRWMSAQAKDAKSLARYKIPKMTELLLRNALIGEAKRWYGSDYIFLDGSPLLNMTAWSVLYRPELLDETFCAQAIGVLSGTGRRGPDRARLEREFPELKTMQRLGLTRLSLPDIVFFLDVDPAVSMQRIRSRGEAMQVHETEEKLDRLRTAYRLVMTTCDRQFGVPAFTIDGAGSVEEIVTEARRVLSGIIEQTNQ